MKIYVTPNSPEGFPRMGLEVCVKVEKRRHIVLEGRGVMGPSWGTSSPGDLVNSSFPIQIDLKGVEGH